MKENTNQDILEAESRGTEIQAAVLHVIDGKRRNVSLSEQTLNLEDPFIEKYVKRYVSRCRNEMRTREGSFLADSRFAEEMDKYFHQETNLPAFSAAVLKDVVDYFQDEDPRSYECMFIDYRTDDVPYLAVVFLEEQETMTYVTSVEHGKILNSVTAGNGALPSFSKPLNLFAKVNMITKDISYLDEGKWKKDISLIRDRLLYAKAGISKKEVVESVKNITYEIAEEFHENPAVLLGQVKNHINETVREGMPFKPETLAAEVFEEKPLLRKAFLEKSEEKTLPKEVALPKATVTVAMKKQKISTDTGIDISIPAEYISGGKYIEFKNHDDGTISIEIKGVNKITNKL